IGSELEPCLNDGFFCGCADLFTFRLSETYRKQVVFAVIPPDEGVGLRNKCRCYCRVIRGDDHSGFHFIDIESGCAVRLNSGYSKVLPIGAEEWRILATDTF